MSKSEPQRGTSGHHRHRPWYKQLWKRFNRNERAMRIIVILAILAVALVIGYIGSHSDSILPNRPRRMVETQRVDNWSGGVEIAV